MVRVKYLLTRDPIDLRRLVIRKLFSDACEQYPLEQ